MEEAPENGKESPHSAHANGMNGMSFIVQMRRGTLWKGAVLNVHLQGV